ncbi:MAG: type VI secretion system-associated FHA domain protein [Jhaorihella sp.]
MVVTLKFQSSGRVPGNARPAVMQGGSLTVGRGPADDLVLPDPDRVLSKSHCVIEDHNGNVVVVDLSTNGTFLNYSRIPLGRTPTPLNNGDVLSVGSYELAVEISDELPDFGDLIAQPSAQVPASPGVAGLRVPEFRASPPSHAAGASLILTQAASDEILPDLAAGLLAGRIASPSVWSAAVGNVVRLLVSNGLPDGADRLGLFHPGAPVWAEARPL